MKESPPTRPRKPRTDGLRNRERVLEAAKTVFNAEGPDRGLQAIARQAGVGIGTLYRHFPTREALFEAVYRHEVDQLTSLATHLKTDPKPTEALRRWMHASVEFVATKKAAATALALATQAPDLIAYSAQHLTAALASLMHRAEDAGEIRQDITPENLLHALIGLCLLQSAPGWQTNTLRLIGVHIDGLRTIPRS